MKQLRCICGEMCETVIEKYSGKFLCDGELLDYTVDALEFYRCKCGEAWFGGMADYQITQEIEKIKMSKNTIAVQVITRLQDNGDGGYTLYAYNNNEELLANHPSWDGSDEMAEEILNEEDPYENGYIGSDTITLRKEGNGFVLAEPLSFHAGQ